MDKHLLDGYQLKLERERTMLLAEIRDTQKPVSFGEDTTDEDEGTDQSEEIGNQLALAQDLKNRLDDVENALAKFATGKYGVCEKCGREIETEILDIDPESRLCKSCKAGE